MELDLISEDKQVLFDTAIRKLAEQGHPSISGLTNMCAYQTLNGSRCALGWLMTDRAINIFGEFEGPVEEIDEFANGRVGLEFLSDLQDVHDYAATRAQFRNAAYTFASKYRLDTSTLQTVLTDEWCTGLWRI